MALPLSQMPALAGETLIVPDKILALDFKKIGLYCPDATKETGGRKIAVNYYTRKNGLLAVRFLFDDVKDTTTDPQAKPTFETVNSLKDATDIRVTGQIIDSNGNVWGESVKYEAIKNKVKLKLSRYRNAFVNLQKDAEEHESPQVRMVTATLLEYYNEEINIWQNGNYNAFIDAMQNEPEVIANPLFDETQPITAYDPATELEDQNPNYIPNKIWHILNTVVEPTGKKVIDSIIEQTTGIKWQA